METETESKRQGLITHLDRYGKHPVVSAVLAQDSTFKKDVDSFYDISRSWGVSRDIEPPSAFSELNYELRKRNPLKSGKVPRNLIEILEEFRFIKESFAHEKLSYDAVRKDCKRWNDFAISDGNRTGVVIMGASAIALGGIYTMSKGAVHDNTSLLIPGLIAVCAAFTGGTGAIALSQHKPANTNGEFDEYKRLYQAAEEADSFIDEHYRKYFIRNAAEK